MDSCQVTAEQEQYICGHVPNTSTTQHVQGTSKWKDKLNQKTGAVTRASYKPVLGNLRK